MILKSRSKGQEVKELQKVLGLKIDGDFGKLTEQAVIHYQQTHGLNVDGVVDDQMLNVLGLLTTDHSERDFVTNNGLLVTQRYLRTDQYMPTKTSKHYLFLHHTAGWHNPYNCIDDWDRDSRGLIATEFVIGGQSVRGDNNKYDGEILQAFPEGGWAWHLGIGNTPMHSQSVGIEACNFGYLLERNGDLFTYPAKDDKGNWIPKYMNYRVDPSQTVKLSKKFRTYQYWHRYSNEQMHSLKELILHIANRDHIDIRSGLIEAIRKEGPFEAFEFKQDVRNGQHRGMWTHANVRIDKTDMFPQQELVDMLLSL